MLATLLPGADDGVVLSCVALVHGVGVDGGEVVSTS